jgi:calcium/calmodulin-dependent protein kinase (CaM kinase) II
VSASLSEQLLSLNQQLLDSIATGEWATYERLCDPSLTAFEPEALGQLVQGMAFHQFYFDLGGIPGRHHTTMCSPQVRLLGDTAVITYVRLIQRQGPGGPVTSGHEETRIWHKQGEQWKQVHFHRSRLSQKFAAGE